jgi:hypothetical protein
LNASRYWRRAFLLPAVPIGLLTAIPPESAGVLLYFVGLATVIGLPYLPVAAVAWTLTTFSPERITLVQRWVPFAHAAAAVGLVTAFTRHGGFDGYFIGRCLIAAAASFVISYVYIAAAKDIEKARQRTA